MEKELVEILRVARDKYLNKMERMELEKDVTVKGTSTYLLLSKAIGNHAVIVEALNTEIEDLKARQKVEVKGE